MDPNALLNNAVEAMYEKADELGLARPFQIRIVDGLKRELHRPVDSEMKVALPITLVLTDANGGSFEAQVEGTPMMQEPERPEFIQ